MPAHSVSGPFPVIENCCRCADETDSRHPESPLDQPEPTSADDQPPRPFHLRQLALQAAALVVVLSLAWPYCLLLDVPLPWPETAWAIGAVAGGIALVTRQPWWWCLIHALFAPAAWATSGLALDPGWFLAAFVLLLLVYRGALAGRIPLYLSGRATAATLADLLPREPGLRCADLGAGVGSAVLALARQRPDLALTGVENSPLVWLIGRLRSLGQRNVEWRWGDFWQVDLAPYGVVYVFLSPAPMPALWEKVRSEMKPGSLFVSNAFAVPEVEPSEVVEVEGSHRLYCYRL